MTKHRMPSASQMTPISHSLAQRQWPAPALSPDTSILCRTSSTVLHLRMKAKS